MRAKVMGEECFLLLMRPISLLFSLLRDVLDAPPPLCEGGVDERSMVLVALGATGPTVEETGRLRTGGLCSVGRRL